MSELVTRKILVLKLSRPLDMRCRDNLLRAVSEGLAKSVLIVEPGIEYEVIEVSRPCEPSE